jgi:hypothetical protein
MPAFSFQKVVNNSSVLFRASLSLFTINGVPIDDFSIFSDAVNPRLLLIDSTQPVGNLIEITAGVVLDYTVDFQFTCTTTVFDAGGEGGDGMPWVKINNQYQPNPWKFQFQADKGDSGAEYTMELESFGVTPRAEDVATS